MTAVAEAVAATGYPAARARWSVALVLTASFVVLADVSIVNLAAPVIQRGLGASVGDIELTVAGYQLAYGAVLVTGGRLGDLYGRRALFRTGFAGFVFASAACGLARTPGQLIAFRVVQGATAGLLSPQVLATIQLVLPPDRRARAFAALGAVLGSATILGPVISGVLISGDILGTGWRPIFLINVPIGVAAVILARWLVPADRVPGAGRADVAGTVLVAAVCAAALAPLTLGGTEHWPLWTWLSLAAAPALVALLVLTQRRLAASGRDPLLPPELWRDPAFRAGLLLNAVLFSGLVCFFLYYSLVLQSGYHLSTLTAGLSTVPSAVGTLALSALTPRVLRRRHARSVVTAGAAICSAAFASMLLPLELVHDSSLAVWTIPSQIAAGAGFGLVLAPLLSVVLAGIRSPAVGAAAGLLGAVQVIGGGVGVVAMGLIFQTVVTGSPAATPAHLLSTGLARGVLFDVAAFAGAALLLRRLPTGEVRP